MYVENHRLKVAPYCEILTQGLVHTDTNPAAQFAYKGMAALLKQSPGRGFKQLTHQSSTKDACM